MAGKDNRAGTNGSRLKTFYVLLGVLALAGVALLAYLASGAGGGGAVTEPVELTGIEDPQALVAMAEGVTIGDPDAPVRIIEFGDYQCPACGAFARRIESRLREEYVESGEVLFTFYDFPLIGMHEHAFLAARAARCAGAQDAYWSYHDVLFGRQSDWAFADDAVERFVAYAGELGLDVDAFETCLRSDRFAEVVTANRQLGERLGVRSTPTLIIGGRQVDPFNYEAIQAMIQEGLGT